MRAGLLSISALSLIVVAAEVAAGDWPRFRGPSGNGIVNDKLELLATPQQRWTADVGEGNASLIVQDGRIYTAGAQRGRSPVLTCLDADTGKSIWQQPVDSWSADSSPTVVGDKGFLLCSNQKPILYCFRLSDGATIWRKELAAAIGDRHYGHAGSPTLWRDLVIVNVGLGTALKQDSGATVWSHVGLSGLATPILYEDKGEPAVMIFAGEALYGREASSGRELWSIPWKTELAVNACDPIHEGGKVFISTTYGKHAALFDITVRPPREIWKERGSSFSSGFLWGRHLFCFGGSEFSCLEFETGKNKWSSSRVGGGSALLAGDKVLLLSDDGRLSIAPVSVDRFQPVLETRIHGGTTWTPPSLVNGRLFVRNKNGSAVCLQIGK
jgi:outer membrane protein assembly factor BamB